MTVDGLFHNVLTELVFFEKVTQFRKHPFFYLQLGQSNDYFYLWWL